MAKSKKNSSQQVNEILLELSDIDKQIELLESSRDSIFQKREALGRELENRKEILSACEAELVDASKKRQEESERLKEEEQIIIERRSKISAIGGAKAAKIAEKEIELSSKSLQVLEESVSRAENLYGSLKSRVELVEGKVEEIDQRIDGEQTDDDSTIWRC